ncbi:MAG: AAA family ATPase [Ruminococcaceae bacterium]|nr:AAA family ATPase [Oscillospiraceae bacterium]
MLEKLNLNLPGQSAQQYDPITAGKMKADTVNSIVGTLTGHDCPKCLNRGSIAFPRDDGTIFTKECSCMKIRRCVWEMERSGLKNVIRDKTFDAYIATEQWQQAIKAGAMAYADNPDGWLLFCGQSGSGKTHLCTAACRQRLLSGDEVRYMPWRDKVAELKALALDNEHRADMINGYKSAQILYIDDLFKVGKAADGSTNPTGADVSLAFEIINYRYVNHLPTIISSEKTPQELVDIDEATGSRIIEMSGSNVFSIGRDSKRNYRLRGIKSI